MIFPSNEVNQHYGIEKGRPEGGVDAVLDVGHNPPALEQLLVKVFFSIFFL